ncbi:MAG: hypothetical protein KAJ28_01040 [Flavobacteriaceae bacterium]|nr:hypothetical protein [Flavobacteriaceae bacterium]
MKYYKQPKVAKILRNIARYTLLFLISITFIFALLSGSKDYGEGFTGILKNRPNTLPWLLLFLLLFIAWKRKLLGGIIVTLFGLYLMYFFYSPQHFYLSSFILTLIITLLGFFFILSWYLRKNK